MIHEFVICGRKVKTGDVVSTSDGTNSIYSLGYRLLGKLIPGETDHSVLYVGPGGLCVEAGISGAVMDQPMISLSPSIMLANSSGLASASF